MSRRAGAVIALAALILVAVSAAARWNAARPSRPPASTGAAPDSANARIRATIALVSADVDTLQRAPLPEVQRRLPAHERLVTDMLDEFESRIRAMHVTADPDWVAVIDSVRTDLRMLPTLDDARTRGFLPGHLQRVMRIVACIAMVH